VCGVCPAPAESDVYPEIAGSDDDWYADSYDDQEVNQEASGDEEDGGRHGNHHISPSRSDQLIIIRALVGSTRTDDDWTFRILCACLVACVAALIHLHRTRADELEQMKHRADREQDGAEAVRTQETRTLV